MHQGTHRCNVAEQFSKIGNDPIYILVSFNEPMTLAICYFSDHIESVELQPVCNVEAPVVSCEKRLCLLQEKFSSVVDKRFILHKSAHRKCCVDTAAELGVEVVVRGAEKGCQTVTLDNSLLDRVKLRLWPW